ncbi:phenylpropionate dioxygenase-like ring-hydroxylating dioxygenase large terminal subunit [Shimia isoporae]|uniref:Phenylpropionate dioxygenase-like ring-hydroxylating dioxygenase large terminal subunit n=1 Tax=Shimia isoporae TaxID=647720 RepID=A0A4R1NTK6_9RHOB|nr:aromatic ring-hydroxylating dioxygenase subunit alpha [Shimia isoporae]TCL10143.1 phenylpropionate dioxygenase-like ring-hydroxylating dioxygenase large terminal subunit [Shimia isoporae]
MTEALTRSLEARYYTAPEVYEAEKQGLLSRTWQFAGHVSQIPEVGAYFAFEIAGESLFAIRGRDMVVRVFYNVCQHRAHQLVEGTGSTRVVVCPYHQWTYELTGGLRAGPNIKSVPGFDRAKVCLTEVRCEDFLGFLFVNLDKDAAPMDEWYPGVRAEIAEYVPHVRELAPVEWVECPENCNWKVSVENYSECYHCPTNHPTFAEGVVKPETYDIQPDAGGGYVLRHVTECQSLEKMTYPIDMSVPHAGDYQSWFLWPMFSFQCYPGNVLNTYHWRAEAVDQCTVWRGWYTVEGEESDVIRKLAVQDRETTVAEDIELVESVQRGLQSRGYVPGPLVLDPACGVMSEHSIRRLQQWMREAVDG